MFLHSNHKLAPDAARSRTYRLAVFGALLLALTIPPANAQNTAVTGSVPSGPASDQVLELTLRDAIMMALRYNLGEIEGGENIQIARGQRLLALSNLLPQVSAGASETVQQLNLGTVGLSGLNVPAHPDGCWPVQLQLGGRKHQPNTL